MAWLATLNQIAGVTKACRNRFFRPAVASRPPDIRPGRVRLAAAEPAPPVTSWPLIEHPLSLIPIAYSLLILSRDPAIRKLLCKLLAKPRYHTHQLGDAAQLASELRARKIDVLIIDLDESEQPGLETVAAVQSKYPKLRIIVLSGFQAANVSQSIASVPGSTILPKPFRRELLLETVQNALVEAARSRVLGSSTPAY
jgi:CheY-like chemotaxis protein